jgi:hypothetical protein
LSKETPPDRSSLVPDTHRFSGFKTTTNAATAVADTQKSDGMIRDDRIIVTDHIELKRHDRVDGSWVKLDDQC